MKGVDRYFDNYNPGHYAPEGTYDTNNFSKNLTDLLQLKNLTQEEAEEVFFYIIRYEEEDGVERDEFGNVIEEEG